MPAAPAQKTLQVDTFLGCDFTSHPAAVDPRMSPWAPNMIRDVPGKVRKCMGYETVKTLPGRINGACVTRWGLLLHAGSRLYLDETQIYGQMADARSRYWLYGEKVYVADGSHYLVFDGTTVAPVAASAKVPLVTIGKAPGQGGTRYEELNLLTPAFTEQFLGTAADKVYQLSFAPLDAAAVTAKKRTAQGGWQTLTEGVDFSVNRTAGTLTFVTAPGESPVTGEDNLSVTAHRTVAGYAERVCGAVTGILYGEGGAPERLFLGGAAAGRDYYSAAGDLSYFGDLSYCQLTRGYAQVVGYTVVDGLLATHLTAPEGGVVLRKSTQLDGKTVFVRTGRLEGPPALSPVAFAQLAGEPVFLTAEGVMALTPDDVTGTRYAQNRSWYLDGRLRAETPAQLAGAVAYTFHDFCWVAMAGRAYLLDGLQPLPPAAGKPYSTRQYAGFYRRNLPARLFWEADDRLWFGTADGRVCRFFADKEALASYTDDGAAIAARWETPELCAGFDQNKRFGRLTVQLAAAPVSSVQVFATGQGVWQQVAVDSARLRYFDWSNLDWAHFSWSGDTGPRRVWTRLRLRRAEKVRLALENKEKGQPFGILALALGYTEQTPMKE